MSEFVLNDAAVAGDFVDIEEAAGVVASVGTGMASLIDGASVRKVLRLHKATTLLKLGNDFSLSEVLIDLLKRRSASGRLFATLATKYPVEEDVEEGAFEALVNWELPDHPGCLALALCASTGRVGVTLTKSLAWKVDPLPVKVVKDPSQPANVVVEGVDNLFSSENAAAIVDRRSSRRRAAASAAELWRDRVALFPRLDFAPGLERNLAALRDDILEAAVGRLEELNDAAAEWARDGLAEPRYRSKVTGESGPTMDKYGYQRVFKSALGGTATFEKHARLHDAYRVHLLERPAHHRLEIGYVGPHLDIVSEN